ncbi:MAG: non-histone chromosomal MC1 family protein, partial [Haloferacaceae archaeon]
MSDDNGKRRFALREHGEETSVFTGNYPRQAALKAARQLDPTGTSEADAEADAAEIRLREHGTDTVHVYEAWAWEEEAPDDGPEWLGDTVTQANVSKEGVEHLD